MIPADSLTLTCHRLASRPTPFSGLQHDARRKLAKLTAKTSIRRALTGRDEAGRFLPEMARQISWGLAEADLDALGL